MAVLVVGVVAAVGFMFDVVMGFVAPNRGMEPMQAAAIEDLVEGSWSGRVVCDGGDRDLTVSFDRTLTMQFEVVAEVVWTDGTRPIGDYLAKGTFDGTRLSVTPDGGGSGPRPLALQGAVAELVDSAAESVELLAIAGDVLGDPSCSVFTLTR